jgi:uncharacterized protein (DUF433 family)
MIASSINDLLERITISFQVCDGQPVIRGMRITVKTILEYLAAGETPKNILQAYPQLEQRDIQACLQFSSHTLRRKVSTFELAC